MYRTADARPNGHREPSFLQGWHVCERRAFLRASRVINPKNAKKKGIETPPSILHYGSFAFVFMSLVVMQEAVRERILSILNTEYGGHQVCSLATQSIPESVHLCDTATGGAYPRIHHDEECHCSASSKHPAPAECAAPTALHHPSISPYWCNHTPYQPCGQPTDLNANEHPLYPNQHDILKTAPIR
jgi:hypothetical protein